MKKGATIFAILLGGLILLGGALWFRGRTTSPTPANRMHAVDLSKASNCRLDESIHPQTKANSLSSLMPGRQTFLAVPFEIGGIVLLSGRHAKELGGIYPRQSPQIPVGRACHRLHILMGTGWQEPDGTPIAQMRCRFENGTTIEVPVKYGIHVRNWWADGREPDAAAQGAVAWKGSNGDASAAGCTLRLYAWTWDNPVPNQRMVAIEWTSLETACAPFLVAITATGAP